MKRYKNFWEEIISRENLVSAYHKACRSKNKKSHATKNAIRRTSEHFDQCIDYLEYIMKRGTWKPSKYKERVIYEPKKRVIYIAKFFPDRVIHHAIVDVLESTWDKLMIYDTYSCRKGKGQHAGSQRCMQYVKRYPYCLKCDISKFYPSIDHNVLKSILVRKIKDKEVMRLLCLIIDSFPGGKNTPIGNLTSQWFGNIYMSYADDYIKQTLHVKGYIRYCDDFILFGEKQQLKEWGEKVKQFIEERLLLSFSKFDLFPVTRGIDFLGYRHFPDGYMLVRKKTAKRMKKSIAAIPYKVRHGEMGVDQAISTIASTEGWLCHANSHNLRMKLQLEEMREDIKSGKIFVIRGG